MFRHVYRVSSRLVSKGFAQGSAAPMANPAWRGLETLESRLLLATISIDTEQVIRSVNTQVLGTNINWWDGALTTAQTKQLVQDAGLTGFRFPGGSSSDEFHFNNPPEWNTKGTAATFAKFVASVNGVGMVTLNYGTGSPQEAAAFLAYLNGSTSNTTALGNGQQWSDASSSWVQKDWKTAGYWASVRAATPLPVDDGLNFLRIGRAAPFGFKYFEIGNEVMGSWEVDRHGQGGDTGAPHDPATYVKFAKQFADYAQQIDPAAQVGLVAAAGTEYDQWTSRVLDQCNSRSWKPNFLIDHNYMQAPFGGENDQNLLLHTISDPSSHLSWSRRATDYRNLLNQKLGAAAGSVQLLATEFNSVYSDPGKQTTSLVNGLFLADALGSLLQTEFNGGWVWGLRNSWSPSNNNSSSLYGWRMGGDYGLLGSGPGPAPQTGDYVPYPTYFAEQLLSKMVQSGGTVIKAASDDLYLRTYATRQADGRVHLLVINKSATSNLTGTFGFSGFVPAAQAQFWQYGKAEDTAQSLTSDGRSSLTSFSSALSLSEDGFSYVFPAYSMTVIELVSGIDQTAPIATTTPGAVTSGAATYTFTVRYSDNVAIKRSTLDGNDILVEGPNGFRQLAQFLGASLASDGSPITATYSISAPGGTWDDADNGSYQIAVQAGQVTDASGNAVAAGRIGVFNAGMDTTPPAATLTATKLTAIETTYRFTVTYVDGASVLRSTLNGQDIRVVGPQGSSYQATAQLLSVSGGSGNAQTLTATYAITGPGGKWDAADNGTYSVRLVANQVADTLGNYAPAQSLGTFQVAILTIDNPGPLQIDGTANADAITITQGDGGVLTVLLNNISHDYTGVTSLTVFGLEGNDTITLGSSVLIPATLAGGAGNDSIIGGKAADLLRGGGGKDTLRGGGAADTLNGNGGADLLVGNGGRDRLSGGGGNDTLNGSGASDTLIGGNGSDLLQGGGGDDWLLARDSSADTLTGGSGTDRAQTDPILDLLSDVESLLA